MCSIAFICIVLLKLATILTANGVTMLPLMPSVFSSLEVDVIPRAVIIY